MGEIAGAGMAFQEGQVAVAFGSADLAVQRIW